MPLSYLRRPLLVIAVLLILSGCGRQPATPDSSQVALTVAAQPTATTPAKPAQDAPTAEAPTPPATATATTAPSPTPSPAPSPAPASATPAVVVTVQAEASAVAIITGAAVNLRSGPGADYDVVGQVVAGQRYPVLGRTPAGDWWQIDVDGLAAWISASLASLEGDPAALPMTETVTAPPAAAIPVQFYEIELTIPTYPYAAYSSEAFDPVYNWTYPRLDRTAYEAGNPQPAPMVFHGVVLENEYLRIVLLPELGGRIYQVIYKPTGSNQLYQNPVLKPSPWGPAEQGGWLAAGGIEWGLPVAEHGYAWRDPWGHITTALGPDAASVTVFMPAGEHLRADIDVILRAGEAAFTIQPRIVNPTGQAIPYQFWLDAMLAPGPANRPGPNLRFILPTDQVTVHSRGDDYLPSAGQAMSWPVFNGVDYSRLGNWNDWLGVFERPAAHGPFAGVYDPDVDEGMMRVFPPLATPGSKIFAMGYAAPISPDVYTDDGSAYVELHGGVTPTYDDQATLAAGATYTWQETWFPVAGIGGVSYADGGGAVHVTTQGDELTVAVFPVRAVTGRIQVTIDNQTVLDEAVNISPVQPSRHMLTIPDGLAGGRVAVTLFDQSGAPVINYR